MNELTGIPELERGTESLIRLVSPGKGKVEVYEGNSRVDVGWEDKKLLRKRLVEQLETEGVGVDISGKRVWYVLGDNPERKGMLLEIKEEDGEEVGYIRFTDNEEEIEIGYKFLQRWMEGNGIMAMGLGLVAEYGLEWGKKRISGKAEISNKRSHRSRELAPRVLGEGFYETKAKIQRPFLDFASFDVRDVGLRRYMTTELE